MPPRVALVSGCDTNYFPLLLEWLHSVRAYARAESLAICILDAGLTAEQRELLADDVDSIVRPDWPVPLAPARIAGKEYLKACVCRPFLPDIFPAFDTYMWMDADTWVQDTSALDLFIAAATARGDRMALTGSADRAYPRQAKVKWLWRWPVKVSNFYFSNARKPFGFEVARSLLSRYTLSAGCFALNGSAPHWRRWQDLATRAMQNGKLFTAEQVSLGVLLHIEDYPREILPAYAHWLCGQTPLAWDADKNLFVEPYMPHVPIGVMHMAGVDDMRADRNVRRSYQTLTGELVQLNYRYPHFDGGRLETGSPERA